MFKQYHNTGQSLREESKTAVWTYFLYSRSSDLFFEGNSEINDQSHKQILTSLLTWVSFTLGTKLRWRSITTSNLLFSSFFSSLFRSRNKTSITYNDTIFSTDQFKPVKALQKVLGPFPMATSQVTISQVATSQSAISQAATSQRLG